MPEPRFNQGFLRLRKKILVREDLYQGTSLLVP